MERLIIGALEICNLPDLGIDNLQVRVDTGAQTSSLHADNIKRLQKKGKPFVEFDLHPDLYNLAEVVRCVAPLYDTRRIKSSNGNSEERYVIQTTLAMGDRSWPILVTLSNRADMTYLMLLGREGMSNHVLVDPSTNYLIETP